MRRARSFRSPLTAVAALVAVSIGGVAEAANPEFFSDRATFVARLSDQITDNYANPGYQFLQNNAAMSAVLGETTYESTGFNNLNIVGGGVYCAGCNGSFRLSFLDTSFSSATGIDAVGADIVFHAQSLPYHAFITYGDGTTQDVLLPPAGSFWGVIVPERVTNSPFGPQN